MTKNDITIADRVFAGIISALVMGVMAICVPVGLFVLGTRGRGIKMLAIFGTFHIWGTALVIVAGVVGAALGNDRVMALYGHLWGTEEPSRPGLTFALWVALVGIGFCSCLMFGRHHVL